MRYYISDLHFGHENLNTKMDNRGFESVEAMDEYMISRWNSRVKRHDEVVILGDFCMHKKAAYVEPILKRLNGKKDLIIGNHDYYLQDKSFDRSLFQWIEYYRELNDNNRKIVLSHYPIVCYNGQYRKSDKGNAKTFMLYGHVHNTYDEVLVTEFIHKTRECRCEIAGSEELSEIPCQMINCFCMFSDYVPLTLDEWIVLDAERRKGMERL